MDWAAAQERLRGPAFVAVAPAVARLDPRRWPTHAELTALAGGSVNARGQPVRFVPPPSPRRGGGAHYEMRIARSGEIGTRAANWHDLFNALAWIAFPKAKAVINAQHAAILGEGGETEAARRGPARDALTLFDESGIVVVSGAAALLRLIAEAQWKELFWKRRGELAEQVRFIAFGHALLEKALDPFIGIAAKSVFVPVGRDFLGLAPASQVAEADAWLAAHFADRARFPSPGSMAPIPVMGIPGWHPDSVRESFYDDADHFRTKGGQRHFDEKGSESFRVPEACFGLPAK